VLVGRQRFGDPQRDPVADEDACDTPARVRSSWRGIRLIPSTQQPRLLASRSRARLARGESTYPATGVERRSLQDARKPTGLRAHVE
jgi:hypothetical protein